MDREAWWATIHEVTELYMTQQLIHACVFLEDYLWFLGYRIMKSQNMLIQTSALLMTSCMIGEDNGTPLQYSCLENPMNRGAW